jgi:hypothetical protein
VKGGDHDNPLSPSGLAIAFGRGLYVLAKPLDVGFGLLRRWVGVFADLCNVRALWFNIDNKALPIRRASNPPIRESRTSESARDKNSADPEAMHC